MTAPARLPLKLNPGPPIVSGEVEIRAVAVTTTSYVSTQSFLTGGVAEALLNLTWNQGDETSLQMKMQYTKDGPDVTDENATWYDVTMKDTPSAGVASIYTEVLSLANADYADPSALGLPAIDVTGLERVRFAFKHTGGASAPTLGVKVSGGLISVS